MSDQDRVDAEQDVQLGLTFKSFIQSDMGKYLVERAEREREQLLEKLVGVDPYNAIEVAKLQSRVRVLDLWQGWIADAMIDGERAQLEAVDFG